MPSSKNIIISSPRRRPGSRDAKLDSGLRRNDDTLIESCELANISQQKKMYQIDNIDRDIIRITQHGLPLVRWPYQVIAVQLGISTDQVIERMQAMTDHGIIRRSGVVPNHYKLGFTANGMSVWNVPDADISDIGMKVGALEFVSHCYQRPRFLPEWPYNLFAMVHGRSKEEVHDKVGIIANMLGSDDRGHSILFSSKILKKTGLRIA